MATPARFLGSGTLRGGVAVVGAQFIKFLIRFATQVVLARLLFPADYGLVAMVAPVLALVMLVADLGLGQATILRSDHNDRDISSLFWLGVAVNFTFAALVALLSPVIAWVFQEPRLIPINIAFAALVPLAGLAAQPSAIMSRDLRFARLAFIDIVTPIVGSIAGFVAAWDGLGYWALIINSAVECCILPILVWSCSSWRPGFPAFGKSALSMVKVGGQITAYNLAQYVTGTAGNVILAISQGAVPLGLYDKASKTVTQSTAQVINPINRVIVPLLVKLRTDPERYRRVYLAMVQLMLLIGAPGIIYVGIMANPFMLMLLGSNWIGIEPITAWLCLGCVVTPIYASTSWLFVSQDRAHEQLRYGCIVSVISVVCFVAGLPWGPSGVAAGSGLSLFFVSTPYICRGATRSGPVTIRDLLHALLPLAIAGSATSVALVAATLYLPHSTRVVLAELPAAYLVFLTVLMILPSGRRLFRLMRQLVMMLMRAERSNPDTAAAPSLPGVNSPLVVSPGQTPLSEATYT